MPDASRRIINVNEYALVESAEAYARAWSSGDPEQVVSMVPIEPAGAISPLRKHAQDTLLPSSWNAVVLLEIVGRAVGSSPLMVMLAPTVSVAVTA